MKNLPITISAALMLSLSQISVYAQSENPLADYKLEPLVTRYARTATTITARSSARYFDHAELQEADSFVGSLLDFELTVPFWERFQLRFFYLAYTKGEARLIEAGNPRRGENIDIDGNSGTFDLPRAIVDYQFIQADGAYDWNIAAFAGAGGVTDYLDTSAGNVYNHQGRVVLFGLKADHRLHDRLTTLGNLGGRYYYKPDDIQPDDDSDVFGFSDASAALVYDSMWRWVHPAVELVFRGDFGSYNQLTVNPQLLFAVTHNVECKVGTGLGLTSDGKCWSATLEAVLRFETKSKSS